MVGSVLLACPPLTCAFTHGVTPRAGKSARHSEPRTIVAHWGSEALRAVFVRFGWGWVRLIEHRYRKERVFSVLVAAVDFPAEIRALRATFESIRRATDPEALSARINELSEQAAAPDLWDDPEAAQKVTSALSHAQSELERVEKMGQRLEDLETIVELSADDTEMAEEAESELASVQAALSELEVRTLLSGEYDQREAVITIRSGAGGVDAADFAEMLDRKSVV